MHIPSSVSPPHVMSTAARHKPLAYLIPRLHDEAGSTSWLVHAANMYNCSMFAWWLLRMGYALYMLHICSMFARRLLDVCSITAKRLLDRVNGVLLESEFLRSQQYNYQRTAGIWSKKGKNTLCLAQSRVHQLLCYFVFLTKNSSSNNNKNANFHFKNKILLQKLVSCQRLRQKALLFYSTSTMS